MADYECPICSAKQSQTAVDIARRLGGNPSFAALWDRLAKAEADRDRMFSAVQVALEAARRDDGRLKPREMHILYRAIDRVAKQRNPPHEPPA